MIFIDKQGYAIPTVLQEAGVIANLINELTYDLDGPDYVADGIDPLLKFEFDKGIYNHKSVKKLLITIQAGKCCFCESRMVHVADGDVEHFRPKARFKQSNGSNLIYPGYYWLAYDWDNLLLACQQCNQRNKLDQFPIRTQGDRATDHHQDIENEHAEFIHPAKIDPLDHINFVDEYPYSLTQEGQHTIEALNLDRTELNEMRETKLELLRTIEDSMIAAVGTTAEVRTRNNFLKTLRRHINGNREYVNMIQSNFASYLNQL